MIQQLIAQAQPYWQQYVQHEFVCKLADGTLPRKCFQHYLKQDYLYLFQYARAFALGAFKSQDFAQMKVSADVIDVIYQEIKLHLNYCEQWGISTEEVQNTQESAACIAYTRYLLDCGMSGSLADLYAAIAPCAIGYAEIGRYIVENKLSVENNPYQTWIDTYASEDFQQSVVKTCEFFTALCQGLSAEQMAKIQHIFTTATRMEINFWQMGLDLAE